MATKLGKDSIPSGHTLSDFECIGPIATVDGDFESCNLADLGCFNQEGVDSNKFYHGSVCKSKKNNNWFVYFEWGRTGKKGTFQFVQCSSQSEAQNEFAKQLHSKNDKRGEWVNKAGLGKILQARSGEDCYLVRPLATRSLGSPGLPDAARIAGDDVKVTTKKAAPAADAKTPKLAKKPSYDPETIKLMRDMNVAVVNFTKTSIQGGTLPTQASIDQGRQILVAAQKRLVKVGDDLKDQVGDKELRDLTYLLYSKIPKVKPVRAPEHTWILSKDNVFAWQQDLDVFESSLSSASVEVEEHADTDPFGGMRIEMRHLSPSSEHGEFIHSWMPNATKNRHGHVGRMKINNVWEAKRIDDAIPFSNELARLAALDLNISEKPDNQPRKRIDLSDAEQQRFQKTNTALVFHGTRSCNCKGLLQSGFKLSRDLPSGVVVTGKMFGDAAYTADDWKKSAGYTSLSGSYWSSGGGGIRGRGAFMFLFDVIMGRPHVAPGPHGYNSPPKGCHSVFGKAGVSQVQNNEWMVYNVNQIRFHYLVEFDTK